MLESILQAIVNLWHFPRSLVNAIKQRRERIALEAAEAERLDRIRNPSKYLGK